MENYNITIFDKVRNRINRLTDFGKPQEKFLNAIISEFHQSEQRKNMLIAQAYYNNKNEINDRIRTYIDREGSLREAKNLSNTKLAHPFMRKLTNQKVNYLLSKNFSVQVDDDDFAEILASKYFNKKFLKMLKNVGRDSIVNGIAWVQVYYDHLGNLKFKRIPSEEVIAFWGDSDHTILEAVLRVYAITQYQVDGLKKEIIKVEYHTVDGVWYYEKTDDGLKVDVDKGYEVRGHFIISQEITNEEGNTLTDNEGNLLTEDIEATWNKVPFVPFKYNADEVSLMTWIKSLVDDYDINTSDTSNNLQDVPNSIKVVKNYDGTDKGEFTQNLAVYRTAFVSGDGDMHSLETKLDIGAINGHLDRLRKDIYEAGNGVDTQELSLGNASGVALKFRYADLDNDANDMANEFAASIEELMWFIKVDLLNKGVGDYTDSDYDVIFNTDNITNELETIEGAEKSVGVISDETIVANHPWVTDPQRELNRLKKEKEAKLKEYLMSLDDEPDYGTDEPNREPEEEIIDDE